MATINECRFYIPNKPTKNWLEKNNFAYSRIYSDTDSEVYFHRFTVWKFGSAAILEGEIRINLDTKEVHIGCYDYGTRSKYAAFYDRRYGVNDVVTAIDKKMQNELDRLGIKIHE